MYRAMVFSSGSVWRFARFRSAIGLTTGESSCRSHALRARPGPSPRPGTADGEGGNPASRNGLPVQASTNMAVSLEVTMKLLPFSRGLLMHHRRSSLLPLALGKVEKTTPQCRCWCSPRSLTTARTWIHRRHVRGGYSFHRPTAPTAGCPPFYHGAKCDRRDTYRRIPGASGRPMED